jgi:hypothetical protein
MSLVPISRQFSSLRSGGCPLDEDYNSAVLDGGPAVGLAVRVAPELVDLRAAGRVTRAVASARLCLIEGLWRR